MRDRQLARQLLLEVPTNKRKLNLEGQPLAYFHGLASTSSAAAIEPHKDEDFKMRVLISMHLSLL